MTWTNWSLWGGSLTQSSNHGGNSFHTALGKDQTCQWIQGEANSLIDPRVRLIRLFQWTRLICCLFYSSEQRNSMGGPTIKRGQTWFATGQGRAKLGSLHPVGREDWLEFEGRRKMNEWDRTYYCDRINELAAFTDESKTRKINETEQESTEKKRELIDWTETLSYFTFTGTRLNWKRRICSFTWWTVTDRERRESGESRRKIHSPEREVKTQWISCFTVSKRLKIHSPDPDDDIPY